MYDDFYDNPYDREPSIGDEVYSQIKDIICKTIKEQYVLEMERLKHDNEYLHKSLDECRAEKRKLSEWKRQHEGAIQQAIKDARKQPIKQLLEDFYQIAWKPESRRVYDDKCDRCDQDRKIHFKSPSGKDLTETCKCGEYRIEYYPREMKLVRFYFHDDATPNSSQGQPISRYYQPRYSDESDYVEVEPTHMGSDVNDPSTAFEKINSYYAVFINKDRCQAYCDYLNKLNKDRRYS